MGSPAPVIQLISRQGFSADYPLANSNQRNEQIPLRPLRQPLYDTEVIANTGNSTTLNFFQRPLNNTTAVGSVTKTYAETNLQQSAQIPFPQVFAITGFVFETQPGTLIADWRKIYTTSYVQFFFSGTKYYLTIPTTRIPCGVAPDGFAAIDGNTTNTDAIEVHNGIAHVENIYGFTVNQGRMLIQNGEAFGLTLNWATAQTLTSTSTRVRMYILGILFVSL